MKENTAYLKRGGLILIVVAVGGFAADYLFNVGISRLLSAHEYGDYKVAYAFASLFGLAVLLGGDRAAPRVLAGPIKRGEGQAVWEYLRFYFLLGLYLSLLLIGITFAASWLHLGEFDDLEHHALVYAVFAVPLIAGGALLSRTLQSAKFVGMASLPWRVVFPLLKLSLMILAASLLGGLTVQYAILLGIFAVIIICLWQYRVLRHRGLIEVRRDRGFLMSKQWLAVSTPMMAVLLVAMLLRECDLYLLEILGEEHEVGHFAAAATTAHFLMLIQLTLTGLIAPLIGPAMETDIASSKAVFRQGQILMLVLVIPSAVILALSGRQILWLFGSDFAAAYPAFLLLLFGYATWAIAGLASTWLQYGGRGKVVVSISLVALVLDCVLNLILIPRYGINGAALSTAIAFSLAAAANVLVYLFYAQSLRFAHSG